MIKYPRSLNLLLFIWQPNILFARMQKDFYPNCISTGLFIDSHFHHYPLEKDVEGGAGQMTNTDSSWRCQVKGQELMDTSD